VRDSAAPTAAQRDAERALHSGQRFRARILVSPSERSVAQAREQLASLVGSPSLAGEFAARAMRMSSDPSAARGGLLESISALDPAVPESVRLQLPALGEGQLSPVLATGSGFALVLMEQRLASAPLSDAEVEERLTLRLQRIAMESYAQRALMDTGLTVVEPGMAWSWENTR
jgi:parvulin-like peptidyl-prolyl isomerase